MGTVDIKAAPLNEWFPGNPVKAIIAGPCSAETPEQVLQIAKSLAASGRVHLMRAGIWKPRTRPNSFEGSGAPALEWLAEARRVTGLPFAVEVANAEHVVAALEAKTDVLWIGARTTVNPFSVQEIADALEGVDIPVMVKNPINPELNLWIGALERLNRSGITKLAAIHRGFSGMDSQPYRNSPRWEIPVQLKTLLPQIPIFCDPSHIAGKREYLQEIAQYAVDLAMDGLMLETHPSPELAWSDADQQVSPEGLFRLLDELHWRVENSTDSEVMRQLQQMRRLIDSLDEELLRLLARRMQITEEIGEFKKENNVTIFQPERWQEILKTRSRLAEELKLNKSFIRKMMMDVHKEGLMIQARLLEAAIHHDLPPGT
jgi:chorismate mutase